MYTEDNLHCFLYRSLLAPQTGRHCIAQMVPSARTTNQAQGITGILVFDGQRIYQYLEGPQPALQQRMAPISKDRRHTAFTPLFKASNMGLRRFSQWPLAYVAIDGGEALHTLNALHGCSIIDKLQTLIPLLDMA